MKTNRGENELILGLYRYLRNPMYVGVLSILLVEAVAFEARVLFQYAGLVFLAFFVFVFLYEEPALRRKFGTSYKQYSRTVPRWDSSGKAVIGSRLFTSYIAGSRRTKGDSMKRSMWIVTVATLFAAVILAHSAVVDRAGANDDPSGGEWEYLVMQGGTVNLSASDGGSMRKEPGAFSRESFPLERNLDKLGAKGWELVTVTGSPADPIFYLKRRK